MIDYWCNAFTPDRERLWTRVIAEDGLTIRLGARGDDHFVDPAGMVERMTRLGIDTLVIPVCDLRDPAPLDEFAHYAARPLEIREWAADHPGRFAGVFSVDPDEGGDVDAAAAALDEEWCVGLHLHTHSFERTFDDVGYEPYYELCAEHAVPFVMQAGASGGHRGHEYGHPAAIAGPATRFPTIDFVLSHTGAPWVTETVAVATRFANVVVGTATHPPRHWPPELLEFLHGEGRHKILFGTGYPLTGHGHALAQLGGLELDGDLRNDLLDGNARRIFTRVHDRQGG